MNSHNQSELDNLLKNLEALSEQNKAEDHLTKAQNTNISTFTSSPFYYMNDSEFETSIEYLNTTKPVCHNDKIRVAVLVGESSFLSIAPEVAKHADMIIMVDIETKVLNHNEYLYRTMLCSDSADEFCNNYKDPSRNILILNDEVVYMINSKGGYFAKKMNEPQALHMLIEKKKRIPNKHFLLPNNFINCKQHISKMPIVFVHLDLLDIEKVTNFKKILDANNAVVTIANVTNILDYDANYAASHTRNYLKSWRHTGKLQKCVEILFDGQEESIILFSKLEKNYKGLKSQQANSVESFRKFAKQYEEEVNNYKPSPSTKFCNFFHTANDIHTVYELNINAENKLKAEMEWQSTERNRTLV